MFPKTEEKHEFFFFTIFETELHCVIHSGTYKCIELFDTRIDDRSDKGRAIVTIIERIRSLRNITTEDELTKTLYELDDTGYIPCLKELIDSYKSIENPSVRISDQITLDPVSFIHGNNPVYREYARSLL